MQNKSSTMNIKPATLVYPQIEESGDMIRYLSKELDVMLDDLLRAPKNKKLESVVDTDSRKYALSRKLYKIKRLERQ